MARKVGPLKTNHIQYKFNSKPKKDARGPEPGRRVQDPRAPDDRPADWPVRNIKISDETWALLKRHCQANGQLMYRFVDETLRKAVKG